jgi:hypothetical protein
MPSHPCSKLEFHLASRPKIAVDQIYPLHWADRDPELSSSRRELPDMTRRSMAKAHKMAPVTLTEYMESQSELIRYAQQMSIELHVWCSLYMGISHRTALVRKGPKPGDIRRTFSFRALHCGQPLRDFRCDRLGPIIKRV